MNANRTFRVAVVGATGLVGETMIRVLEERDFPVSELYPLASNRSIGKSVKFKGKEYPVDDLATFDFSKADIGLFSAGGEISREFAPKAAAAGCVVIDNTSEFRYQDDIPLVVPEVNAHALAQYKARGIIANPNCSTIQMVVALKPIHDAVGIERINVATYQSVSGAGREAVEELAQQTLALMSGEGSVKARVLSKQIAFNVIPHIDKFESNGYTKEEMKMVWETQKIMEDPTIRVNATAVRVPVFFGHSEAVHIETRQKITAAEARALLKKAPGVTVLDERKPGGYPTAATEAANRDTVYVGRIREDISSDRGLNLWIVSDNVRKGAATNSVQIAEIMVRDYISATLPPKFAWACGMRSTHLIFKRYLSVVFAPRGVLMVAKSVKWALASLVIALPPSAFALGLGDVRLLSSLNAPLDAEIELVGATPEEMAVLKAQLASKDLFARNGLDMPTSVGNITITPQTKPDGKPILRMRSTQAVTDPFLTLLVEVDALRTHTVREYTLLLDPPVFAPGEQQNAPVNAPSTGAGAREGAITRQAAPAPSAEPRRAAEPASGSSAPSRASAAPASRPSGAGSAAEGGSRTVRPGETLSGIANEVASDSAQTRAWMLAIYQNNPSAFDGNMNVLRSGAVLRIPNASAVSAIAPSDATAEIRRQYASWRGGAAPAPSASEPGRLRLVPPGAPAGAGAPNAQADAALQGRVRDLESQLADSKRLLEARNAELAQLQARLANQPAAAPTPAPTPAPAAQPTPPPPAATAQPPAEAIPPPAAETTPPPAEQPPAAQETPAPAQEAQSAPPVVKRPTPAAAPADEGGGILDLLKEYWWALAGLVVVILALFGVKAMRARKQNDFDDSLSRLAGAAAGADALDRDTSTDTQPLRAQSRESAFVVEESGTHERPRFSSASDFTPATAPRNVAADETISSETAINLDQGDPLAEADFHMAYGLYDQAADLVRIAISREPDRRDLKLKLLEVFFVWGNKDQFLQTAHELAETRDQAAPGEWEKIVIMGKQLAPEDALFAGSGGGGGAGLGMDLDLEGGQDRVDFDILGDPVPSASSGNGIDLDIGSALGESASDGSATVTDANLALHEDGFTADDAGTGITREMTQNLRGDNSPTVQQYGADFEAPTVEQPGLYGGGNNPTIRQKVESAMKHGGLAAEQTAELAIDDLGLDLGALEEHPNLNSTQEAPTLVAGLDERSRRIMDEAERRGMKDMDATAIASTGAWNLSGEDLEHTMQSHDIPGYANGEGSETSRLAALKGGDNDLDFNFNDEEPAAPPAKARGYTNGSGAAPDIDLDVGTATVPDAAFTATQKLSSEDLALPDLEPVTMSEVGTKLDLARAYMDMGDPEGARNILEEVMTEGSLAQKQEAQRLLESLPG